MISPVLREELRSLKERVSMFMELRDRGELPDAEARASCRPLIARMLDLFVECGAPLKVVGLTEDRTLYQRCPGFAEWCAREIEEPSIINACREDTVNLGGSTYEMDMEDWQGESHLLLSLMAEASEFLEQGDVKAARMVLEVWWLHSCGHMEVEENRPVHECRVCQDPATKRMLTKWAKQASGPSLSTAQGGA